MMFVSGCVKKMASKIASFFLHLNFQVLAHDCDQDERKCDQKNGTRDNSATGTEKIFRALRIDHVIGQFFVGIYYYKPLRA